MFSIEKRPAPCFFVRATVKHTASDRFTPSPSGDLFGFQHFFGGPEPLKSSRSFYFYPDDGVSSEFLLFVDFYVRSSDTVFFRCFMSV